MSESTENFRSALAIYPFDIGVRVNQFPILKTTFVSMYLDLHERQHQRKYPHKHRHPHYVHRSIGKIHGYSFTLVEPLAFEPSSVVMIMSSHTHTRTHAPMLRIGSGRESRNYTYTYIYICVCTCIYV